MRNWTPAWNRVYSTMEKITAELNPALDGAWTTSRIKLASAAGNERRARDAMLDLARILAPKRDKEEVIRRAIRDIEKAMVDQEQVKSDTEKLEESEEIKAEPSSARQSWWTAPISFARM